VKRILVALDDSEASQRAAQFVNEFFAGSEHEVIGLNVSPAPVPWIPPVGYGEVYAFPAAPAGVATPEDARAAEAQAEETAAHTVEEVGLEADERYSAIGEVVGEICRAALDHDVDLIVVGSHDKGAFKRFLTGSVSTTLVHEAPRPVLVVR
jgi:nucleotide-binding universal stress UspA family protein